MEPLIRLVGLKGCSGDTYAYFSRDKENVPERTITEPITYILMTLRNFVVSI